MFRTMRRFRQQLTHEECERILAGATSGVLALSGDDGYPYAVPLSHVYQDGKLYFHCAKEGHKIDAIRRNDKVSFCVIAQDEVIPSKRTTAYISVIAFGRAVIVDDEPGLRRIAGLIGEKFSADYPEDCRTETEQMIAADRMYCLEITVEHLTGKCGLEVLRTRT
jgi:nitroimidazol reductase NimA-like FMN-containing flavoprotein (pyridoxamine 5'-phosphate oxidase superfamily)